MGQFSFVFSDLQTSVDHRKRLLCLIPVFNFTKREIKEEKMRALLLALLPLAAVWVRLKIFGALWG